VAQWLERSPSVPWVSGSSPGLGISEIYFSSPYTVRRRGVDLQNLCLRTNVWVAATQALVAAITGEANRLLSLDLSSLGDRSQLPGRAAITNSGQGSTIRTKTDITHTDKSSMCGLRLRHICRTAP
jgi:hypothetical protein